MTLRSQDEAYMRRALELARLGTAQASPNPRVGAVLVSPSGEAVGEGFHTFAGLKHAEVLALEHSNKDAQAGEAARGATLYLNLEPCCHQGRTPACTDAIIRAGIKRVVAAMADPNPLVAGKGFAALRAAGITVESGLMQAEARHLNESFSRY